jgi:Ca2+:H+ antiporter
MLLLVTMLPLTILADVLDFGAVPLFIFCCLAIVALASYMGRATESIAIVSGPRIGGLLNATFGNAVELIISIFAIRAGLNEVVLASITGSVIGNLLLVGGLSLFVGGVKHKRLSVNKYDARHNAALLFFGVVIAFMLPYVFTLMGKETHVEGDMTLSIWVSVILIVLYLAAMLFKLVTHRGVYDVPVEGAGHDEVAEWSKKKAITVLALATVAVAYLSEKLVHTIHSVGETFGWSELFIGIIVVAIVGNAAEHASAVVMAYKKKMDIAMEISAGSTLQIAMFVAPVLVLVSLLFGSGMPLQFTIGEIVAMTLSVFLFNKVVTDGDTNWLEGALLLATYVLLGVGFFML